MKMNLLPTLLLVLFQTLGDSQTTGDYQSKNSGLRISTSSLQFYKGSSWVTPSGTAPQGYPGQFSGTGKVLIQSADTITINQPLSGGIATTDQLMETVTITEKLALRNISCATIDYNLTTENSIVTPLNGRVVLNSKVNLPLSINSAVLQVSDLSINNGVCNNTQSFILGLIPSQTLANCEGNLNFSSVSSDVGTSAAKPTPNSLVCAGSDVKLFGGYSGLGSNQTVVYSWIILKNNNNIVNQNGNLRNQISSGNLPGTYKAKFKCGVQYDNDLIVSNSKTICEVVNPTPKVSDIKTVRPMDGNATGTAVFNGLLIDTWKINPGNITGYGFTGTLTGLMVGNYYSFSVTNDFGCVSPAATGSIVNSEKLSSSWSGSWSNGIPDIKTNVIIAGDYDTASLSNLTACSLTIDKGIALTIRDGKVVTIQNKLIVNGTLNIANQGSLEMISNSGTVINNGTIKVNKTTTDFEKYN